MKASRFRRDFDTFGLMGIKYCAKEFETLFFLLALVDQWQYQAYVGPLSHHAVYKFSYLFSMGDDVVFAIGDLTNEFKFFPYQICILMPQNYGQTSA